MGKKKKIIELKDEVWEILEREAKADNRSLKNYIENYFENPDFRTGTPKIKN